MKLILDPGHGGYDPGATGNGLKEKDITLKLALKIRDLLKGSCDVILTRDTDKTVSLQERCDIANKANADYFISIHINSANVLATGFESYISTKASQKSIDLGKKIHDSLAKFYVSKGLIDRGFKQANFYVLNKTKMPAIVIENLFINNPGDAKFLADENFLDELAKAIADALKKALGLQTVSQPSPQPQQPQVISLTEYNQLKANYEQLRKDYNDLINNYNQVRAERDKLANQINQIKNIIT
jgi:N-acetylmuramoyl-L-alanine amidase